MHCFYFQTFDLYAPGIFCNIRIKAKNDNDCIAAIFNNPKLYYTIFKDLSKDELLDEIDYKHGSRRRISMKKARTLARDYHIRNRATFFDNDSYCNRFWFRGIGKDGERYFHHRFDITYIEGEAREECIAMKNSYHKLKDKPKTMIKLGSNELEQYTILYDVDYTTQNRALVSSTDNLRKNNNKLIDMNAIKLIKTFL